MRAEAGCSPARCSHWVFPAAVRSGPPGGSQMCPGEGACEPAAQPGRSPRPCRAEQCLLSHTCSHHPDAALGQAWSSRSHGGATDGPSRPLTAGQGLLQTQCWAGSAVLTLPFGIPGVGHLPEPGAQMPAPSAPDSAHTPSTPHHMSMLVVCVVVPSSSSGARYLQTEAHTSCPALLGLHRAPRICSPPTGHRSFRSPRCPGRQHC